MSGHNGHDEHAIALLPTGELSDETELVFVDGRPFVNAAKHMVVVDVLIGRLERQQGTIRLLLIVDVVLAVLLVLGAW